MGAGKGEREVEGREAKGERRGERGGWRGEVRVEKGECT
jgi:hypothetical protein